MRVARSICTALALACAIGASPAHSAIGWFERMNEDPIMYDDISNESGTITHTPAGTTIDGKLLNNSWTYFFEIPPESRHCLSWAAELEVIRIVGCEWAGLTIESYNTGVSFRVDRRGELQIAYIKNGRSSEIIDQNSLPPKIAKKMMGSFTLGIAYDIRTSELVCAIDGDIVKSIRLPYYGIPPTVSVVGFSMESVTDPQTTLGRVTFGDLTSIGER